MNIWLSNKFCSRWIPHNLSIAKKRLVSTDRKRCPKNTIAVLRKTSMIPWQEMNRGSTRMSPKVNSSRLYGCFKMSQIRQKLLAHKALPSKWLPFFGHVAIVSLEQCRKVNSEWCTTICLPDVFKEIRKTNRQRWITLHHDNASSHTSAQATAFLSTKNIDLMSHPPHIPDLAPNHFFLFPYVKNRMRGQRFLTTASMCACFWDTSIRVAKVLRQLVQTHAKAYRC